MARDEKTRKRRSDGTRLDRRSYMKLAGTAAATAGLAAFSGSAQEYANVVDVTDVGADPTGSEAIDTVLQQHVGSDTVLQFPEGTYRMDSFSASGLSNFAMVGNNATIVPPNGFVGYLLTLKGANIRIEGIEFDYTAQGTGPATHLSCSDGLVVRDVTFRGVADKDISSGHQYYLYPEITSSSGTGLLENMSMPDGAASGTYRGGTWLSSRHVGTITYRNCHIEGFANNSIYGTDAKDGTIHVEGGLYKNNNISNIRLGGKGCTVRGARIVIDGDVPGVNSNHVVNSRAIWLWGPSDTLIEDCDIIVDHPLGSGIIHHNSDAAMTLRNTRFQLDTDTRAVLCHYGGEAFHIENVHVTGAADANYAFNISNRSGTVMKNVCIQQTNGSRGGIYLGNSSNCSITDSTINVGGQAINLNGSTADTSNVTYDGTCQVPSDGSGSTGDDTTDSGSDDTTDSGSDGSTTPEELSELISIGGRTDVPVQYELTVTGDIEKSDVGASTINADDIIDGSTASGVVEVDDNDSYAFAGSIENLLLSADTTVWYNGSVLDPSNYTVDSSAFDDTSDSGSDDSSGSDLTRELVIDGGSRRQWTYYDFTVDGDLEKAEIDGASINDGDTVSGSSAEGFVAGGADAYRFSGEITEFNLDGQADVTLDGELVDISTLPSSQLPNTLVIDGEGTSGRSEYTFEVDGEVEKSRSLGTVTAEDVIDGNTVTGVVKGGTDGYRFSGDITRFQLTGSAMITFEDNDG